MAAAEAPSRTIVICLSRDRSPFSWFAYFTDGGGFTHASIAFDEDADHYYSFNFNGLKKEYRTSLKKRPREMKRYKISVTETQYRELKRIIESMESEKDRYHYSRLGVSLCLFKLPNPTSGTEHLFCSQFVAKVLDKSGCVQMTKAYGDISPNTLEKELRDSQKVTDISDDSTLKPLADSAIDAALSKLEQGKDIVIRFSAQNMIRAEKNPGLFPFFLVRLGIRTADRYETFYNTASILALRSKRIANRIPKELAKWIDWLLRNSTGRVFDLHDLGTEKLTDLINRHR